MKKIFLEHKKSLFAIGLIMLVGIAGFFILRYDSPKLNYDDETLSSDEVNVVYEFVPITSIPERETLLTIRDGKVYQPPNADGEITLYHPDASSLELLIMRKGSSAMYIPGYQKDSTGIINLPQADAASFRPRGSGFATDKNHLYWHYEIITGFDQTRFRFIATIGGEESYITDESQVYRFVSPGIGERFWSVVEGADSKTFKRVPDELGDSSLMYDENRVFCGNKALQFMQVSDLTPENREYVREAIIQEFEKGKYIEVCSFIDALFK